MALLFAKFDDMNSAYKAEDLFKEIIEENKNLNENRINEKGIELKDEFAKFYLKQDRFDVSL
jgi:hypothetical protein